MQCDDPSSEVPALPAPRGQMLSELDAALHELGMLSTFTDIRQEYMKEVQRKRVLNIVEMNTRFVSNVSIGWKVRPVMPHPRYKPYMINRRGETIERHRTKSENADVNESCSIVRSVLDDMLAEQHVASDSSSPSSSSTVVLKRAKSLENIVLETTHQITQLPEIEIANCIQNLKVGE